MNSKKDEEEVEEKLKSKLKKNNKNRAGTYLLRKYADDEEFNFI